MYKLLYFIKDKANCTGCTACYTICPVSCIKMSLDNEGFYYPYYDETKCINCRKCKSICPILNYRCESHINFKQFVVTLRTKNEKKWEESTSGGAFTEICNAFGDQNTYVSGVEMNNLKAKHSIVQGVDKINLFKKSKYIQSDLQSVFAEIKEYLKHDNKLIFIGTPCQIAGLKSFLGIDYENLFLMDFICHGVGSPYFFTQFINYLNQKVENKIINYSFREKRIINGKYEYFFSKYEYENGKIQYIYKDLYNQFFLKQLCTRISCGENCKFRNPNRLSDITIADYKGLPVRKKYSLFPDIKNYSSIIVNTEKGLDVYNKIVLEKNNYIFNSTLDELKKSNPLFFYTTKQNNLRDEFFNDFISNTDFNFLKEKYLNENMHSRNSKFLYRKIKIGYNYIQLIYNKIFGLIG